MKPGKNLVYDMDTHLYMCSRRYLLDELSFNQVVQPVKFQTHYKIDEVIDDELLSSILMDIFK